MPKILIPRHQGNPNLKFSDQYVDENIQKLPKVERSRSKPIFIDYNRKLINTNKINEKNRYSNLKNQDALNRYSVSFSFF